MRVPLWKALDLGPSGLYIREVDEFASLHTLAEDVGHGGENGCAEGSRPSAAGREPCGTACGGSRPASSCACGPTGAQSLSWSAKYSSPTVASRTHLPWTGNPPTSPAATASLSLRMPARRCRAPNKAAKQGRGTRTRGPCPRSTECVPGRTYLSAPARSTMCQGRRFSSPVLLQPCVLVVKGRRTFTRPPGGGSWRPGRGVAKGVGVPSAGTTSAGGRPLRQHRKTPASLFVYLWPAFGSWPESA